MKNQKPKTETAVKNIIEAVLFFITIVLIFNLINFLGYVLS